ncbi:MAG: hypothetical protein LBJ75_04610 [Puniceicoccales bacterium]|nr:hypothetical protein [Puniceicoccales bacterium]
MTRTKKRLGSPVGKSFHRERRQNEPQRWGKIVGHGSTNGGAAALFSMGEDDGSAVDPSLPLLLGGSTGSP